MPPITINELNSLSRDFQKSRIFLSAFELGIFTQLDLKPQRSEEVAQKLNLLPRHTDRFLNALVVLGLLEKENGLFRNTDISSEYLVKGKENYMNYIGHSTNLWDTWSDLTAVISGKHKTNKEVRKRDEKWFENFIAAMHFRGIAQAPMFADHIDFAGVESILDVGGGSGVFAMEFCKKSRGAKAVVFDLPNVVGLTQKYIEEAQMTDYVTTQAGDLYTDEFQGNYDLIYISAIIHMLSPAENLKLIEKCAKVLNSNGRIIISDIFVNEERTAPERGILFAINMLVGTEAGDTYTKEEVKDWFVRNGIKFVRKADLPTEIGFIEGIKMD